MTTFYEELNLAHKERLQRELQITAEDKANRIFARFRAWAKLQSIPINEEQFQQFLSNADTARGFIPLNWFTFQTKKIIFEQHFGYKFEYDLSKNRWKSYKNT